ncbi:YeeE/YedE family protein [Betaproteobacteria bacterium]|nr:YeeE/YedE family protein [Betaproteobacteria bacterium]
MDTASIELIILLCGLLLGVIFGFACQRSRFCFLGIISDIYICRNPNRLSLYLFTLITAVIGVQLLAGLGSINPADSTYMNISNKTISSVFGGLLFGIGMTFCSGCTTSTLIKFGEGNIKSLVILTLSGLAAISTMRGSLGSIRIHLFEDNFLVKKINTFFEYKGTFGIDMQWLWLILLITYLTFLLFKQLKNLEIRKNAIWGCVIGVCIVGAWFVSGNIGFFAEHPDTLESKYILTNSGRPESFSFIGPLAYTLEFFLYQSDSSKFISFGIIVLFGLLLGSYLSARLQKRFKIEFFTTKNDIVYCFLGSTLMGFGGVTASGCTLGHGLSGLSLGSLNSIIVVGSIAIGAVLGIRHMENKVA